jgi:hypothetical protein
MLTLAVSKAARDDRSPEECTGHLADLLKTSELVSVRTMLRLA